MVLDMKALRGIATWLECLNEIAADNAVSLGKCEIWDHGDLVGHITMTDVDSYDFEPIGNG